MLCVSASREASEPVEEGRELLRPERRDLSPPEGVESRTGDLGAVKGENPLGGLAVRMTGGLAASSSRATLPLRGSAVEVLEKAP